MGRFGKEFHSNGSRLVLLIRLRCVQCLHFYLFSSNLLMSCSGSFNQASGSLLCRRNAFSSVQSLSHVWLFETPWITAHQASLSITKSQSLLKPMSIELVMPSNHLILCHPLPLLPSIFPSIRVFSSESVLHIKWSKQCLHLPFVGFFFYTELKDIVKWIPWGRSMILPQGCTIVSRLSLSALLSLPFLTSTYSNLPFGTQGVSHRLESIPYKK